MSVLGPDRGRAAAAVWFCAATHAAYAVRSIWSPDVNCPIAHGSESWACAALTPGPNRNPRLIATTAKTRYGRNLRRGRTDSVTGSTYLLTGPSSRMSVLRGALPLAQ